MLGADGAKWQEASQIVRYWVRYLILARPSLSLYSERLGHRFNAGLCYVEFLAKSNFAMIWTTPSPRITRLPLALFPLMRILAYVLKLWGNSELVETRPKWNISTVRITWFLRKAGFSGNQTARNAGNRCIAQQYSLHDVSIKQVYSLSILSITKMLQKLRSNKIHHEDVAFLGIFILKIQFEGAFFWRTFWMPS